MGGYNREIRGKASTGYRKQPWNCLAEYRVRLAIGTSHVTYLPTYYYIYSFREPLYLRQHETQFCSLT